MRGDFFGFAIPVDCLIRMAYFVRHGHIRGRIVVARICGGQTGMANQNRL